MAATNHIRNPAEWAVDQIKLAGTGLEWTIESIIGTDEALPKIQRIAVGDLKDALAQGLSDALFYRTDVFFLCIMYPVIGLILSSLVFNYGMLPLLFPLASGFALLGPVAAVGLYEMSRRREVGLHTSWANAFAVIHSHAFGAIFAFGLLLLAIFLTWIAAAYLIYQGTLGPEQPASIAAFIRDAFTTGPGWTMIILGVSVGFLFALFVLSISVVSFPLLLDREVGVATALYTSIRAVAENPMPMAVWGMIVAVGLVLGSLPFFVGLIIVMPVLGHATWHLYRKVVA